jgi:hypothetical protein
MYCLNTLQASDASLMKKIKSQISDQNRVDFLIENVPKTLFQI